MTSTITPPVKTSVSGQSPQVVKRPTRRSLLLLGGAGLTLGVAAGWGVLASHHQMAHTNSTTSSANPYAPGGSVYNEQVPSAASVANPYAPGGSVYDEQVPAAAAVGAAANPYAPGGSVYNEQVPAAASTR